MTSTSGQWAGDTEAKPAPGALRRVQSFINTVDLESGQDRLATPETAQPWLVEQRLLALDATLDDDDLQLLGATREELRAVVIHNTGGPPPGSTAGLQEIADGTLARAVVDDGGRVELVIDGDSLPARLLTLLLIVRDAQLNGTWTHLKACANDNCRWAFYDRSRNHGGTWCDMATCGNKLKNRDFRARKRTEPT